MPRARSVAPAMSRARSFAQVLARSCVLGALLIACKPPPDVTCAEASRRVDQIVYAGDTDARTLASHERICIEEDWDANVRACLARAKTRDDLARCAPDTDATAPILRGIVHEAK